MERGSGRKNRERGEKRESRRSSTPDSYFGQHTKKTVMQVRSWRLFCPLPTACPCLPALEGDPGDFEQLHWAHGFQGLAQVQGALVLSRLCAGMALDEGPTGTHVPCRLPPCPALEQRRSSGKKHLQHIWLCQRSDVSFHRAAGHRFARWYRHHTSVNSKSKRFLRQCAGRSHA